MAEQIELRALFLREFAKALILSTRPSLFESLEKASKEMPEIKQEEQKSLQPEKKEIPSPEFIQSPVLPAPPLPTARQAMPIAPIKTQAGPPLQKPAASIEPASGMLKLAQLISDPYVSSIECTEANKPLLITKMGLRQQANILLSEEEIKGMMKEISEKTKIPLLPGIFKVAYQNLLITAIVSDFIGMKFIIQKRNPMTLAPYKPPYYRL